MEQLKPCPVCGKNSLDKDPWLYDCCCGDCGPYKADGFVKCEHCGALFGLDDWNTRAIPEPTERMIEAGIQEYISSSVSDDETVSRIYKAMIAAQGEGE